MNGISFPTNCSGGIYMSGNRRLLKVHDGGEGGIRTHDTLAGMPHFECVAYHFVPLGGNGLRGSRGRS